MLILHFCGKTSYAEVTAAMAGIQSSLHELKVEDEDAGVCVGGKYKARLLATVSNCPDETLGGWTKGGVAGPCTLHTQS